MIHAVLALGHSPTMETDHGDSIRQDWLHLPIPKERATFRDVVSLGEQVATLLDPGAEADTLLKKILGERRKTLAAVDLKGDAKAARDEDLVVTVSYFGAAPGKWVERSIGDDEGSHLRWGETTGNLFLNDRVFLKHVPAKVWFYELGGYPVLKKWLGYRDEARRNGAPLRLDELDHLRNMVHRIAALLTLHDSLDAAYERAIAGALTAEDLGL